MTLNDSSKFLPSKCIHCTNWFSDPLGSDYSKYMTKSLDKERDWGMKEYIHIDLKEKFDETLSREDLLKELAGFIRLNKELGKRNTELEEAKEIEYSCWR